MQFSNVKGSISKLAGLENAACAPSLKLRASVNAATITDLCNRSELAEVEIISLVKESIPKYRLRADSLTEFGGYENQDWFIPSPASKPAETPLTPDQIRETLNYFLLCSDRVSQMTKTYHDIEAVTRLLEEKEKDLELTARIGKELLTSNGQLEARVCALEDELQAAKDSITQLKHELASKSDLLQVLTDDTEEGECSNSILSTETLLRRTTALERENRSLREEAQALAAGTDNAEEQEKQLLRDIAAQLNCANSEANMMSRELSSERERNSELVAQLTSTADRLLSTEKKLAQLSAEHAHALHILEITKENQNALAAELVNAKERYNEVLALLHEAQEQNRRPNPRPPSSLMPHVAMAAGLAPSLHTELHSSVFSDLSLDSGISDMGGYRSVQKVFDTVACASVWSGTTGLGGAAGAGHWSNGSDAGRAASRLVSHGASRADSVCDDGASDIGYPDGTGPAGVPGAPGAEELAAALKRLSPADVAARRARFNRPGSESGESAIWGAAEWRWRTPNKLQIVKPLEGSQTLHTWAQLARPHLAGVLEEQEGIAVRSSRNAFDGHLLTDFEEDDDVIRLPATSYIYTLTNSTVMHPGNSGKTSAMTSGATSAFGSAWSSRLTSRRSSAAGSPSRTRRESVRRCRSPTATPANSPLLGSPDNSPPSSPPPVLRAAGALFTQHRSPMEQLTGRGRGVRRPRADLGTVGSVPRRDLGTVGPTQRLDLGTVATKAEPTPASSPAHSALGTLSSLLFGRKGGLL